MDEQRADRRVTTAADTVEELHRHLADPPSLERLYGILRSYVRKADVVRRKAWTMKRLSCCKMWW
jgi:hypothetical protein